MAGCQESPTLERVGDRIRITCRGCGMDDYVPALEVTP